MLVRELLRKGVLTTTTLLIGTGIGAIGTGPLIAVLRTNLYPVDLTNEHVGLEHSTALEGSKYVPRWLDQTRPLESSYRFPELY